MKQVTNLPASIRAKLFALSKENGEDFERILVRYGIERFLFRLSQHPTHYRFILKGAMLFITWPEGVHRPTGDLDLLGYGPSDSDTMKRIMAEICVISCPDDALVFDPASIQVEPVREDDRYQGVRIVMRAAIDSARIRLQVDVGFGDSVYPDAKKISFPCLLPDMQMPEVFAYPPETVVAEKFEIMVRFGEADSRLKDFNDIWAIMKTFEFDKSTLVEAISSTFKRREIDLPREIPFALTAAFGELPDKLRLWAAFLGRNPPALEPPPLGELLADLRRFLGPLLAASAMPEAASGRWHPARGWSA